MTQETQPATPSNPPDPSAPSAPPVPSAPRILRSRTAVLHTHPDDPSSPARTIRLDEAPDVLLAQETLAGFSQVRSWQYQGISDGIAFYNLIPDPRPDLIPSPDPDPTPDTSSLLSSL